MFRSVFVKFVAALMATILFCFALVALVTTSIITQYSEQAKTDIMATAARSSAIFLEGRLLQSEDGSISIPNDEAQDVRKMLSTLASNAADVTTLVVDLDGRVLLSTGSEGASRFEGAVVPEGFLASVGEESGLVRNESKDELFAEVDGFYAVSVCTESGEVVATVFVCTSSMLLSELLNVIIRAMVVVIACVLVASLIAVYFISARIISPLKEISRAAKQFAAGKFDTRVTVRGRDEVAELAVAFNNMAESLDNYETMRNTFMSNVSHDLRSPMTSIAGFIDGILDGVIPPEKHAYYLQLVSSEIHRLSRLVATLLDLSRIQAGERKFTMASFDVCEMCREILISFEQKINDKHLEVMFDCEADRLYAVADRDAIYQVMYNLCDNAIKFASERGLFRVVIEKLRSKKILVSVYNEGEGISQADLPYVFERFYKSDKSRGLNKSGVGLGLFISKTIIDAHGEKIWVESEFGEDCCFRFTLTAE